MLVSHRHRFIYTKTRKTGGTSVEAYLEGFCIPAGQRALCHHRAEHVSASGIIGARGPKEGKTPEYWNHMPAALIRQKIGRELWDKYLKFCVIRNPYDKVVSAFYFNWHRKRGHVEFSGPDHARASFEQWLVRGGRLPVDREMYVIDGRFCLDTVIRYESLAVDLESVCRRLGLPWEPSALPQFKRGYRPKWSKAELMYGERSRKIVADAFSFELDFFHYSFPGEK
ncbi:MAG: sulfotransferase family 2 domain-containing protein [Acidobacteria bacterium]|nr:sulfotransferase family 2 domain-containing protein [Acidobacteriota bacterium]